MLIVPHRSAPDIGPGWFPGKDEMRYRKMRRAKARVSDATGNCNAFLLQKAVASRNLESALSVATNGMSCRCGAVYFLRLTAIYEMLCRDWLSQTW
nr:hypothetical protein SHINE37_43298 [Rhizobiaceae bacterium]